MPLEWHKSVLSALCLIPLKFHFLYSPSFYLNPSRSGDSPCQWHAAPLHPVGICAARLPPGSFADAVCRIRCVPWRMAFFRSRLILTDLWKRSMLQPFFLHGLKHAYVLYYIENEYIEKIAYAPGFKDVRLFWRASDVTWLWKTWHLFPYNWQKMKRREKFGDYLMDISKYIVTGFVLTAFFDEFSEYRWLIY